MENCFVSQLKAQVTNDNMPYFNIFKLNYLSMNSNTQGNVNVQSYEDVTLTIEGDATWNTGQSHVTYIDTKTIKIDGGREYSSFAFTTGNTGGNVYVYIESEYDIKSLRAVNNQTYEVEDLVALDTLNANNGDLIGDIYYFHNLSDIRTLALGASSDNNTLTGDISCLSNKPKLAILNLRQLTAISGDINALKDSKNIENINVRGCSGIIGSLNNLLDALALAGKTGSLTFDGRYSGVTYTGIKDVRTQQITFTFSNGGWTEDA